MMLAVLILFIVVCLACLVYRSEETDTQRIHRNQQKALRRHLEQRQADQKRIDGYWKERGRVIRPREPNA
jgi:Tfp pilus assembly protein PilO